MRRLDGKNGDLLRSESLEIVVVDVEFKDAAAFHKEQVVVEDAVLHITQA